MSKYKLNEDLSDELKFERLERKPPIHLWSPNLSGDIDILIKRDGSWWHDGAKINRKPLVKFFAGLLRREVDGEYYLVTPEEKWRITVELLPLMVIGLKKSNCSRVPCLNAVLNTDEIVPINSRYKIQQSVGTGGIASIVLWNGLSGFFNRSSWYELVNLCDDNFFIHSYGERFKLY